MAVVFLARLEIWRRPGGFVGRVGILLTLKTNRNMLRIFDAMFATYASTLEVACVYLNTRLIGVHRQTNLCNRRPQNSANLCIVALAILICIKTPVVVVASSIANLVERSVVDSLL